MAILSLICLALLAYQLVVVAAIITSWFPIQPGSGLEAVQRALRSLTEPVLDPLRQRLPAVRLGGAALDLSPLVVLLGLLVLRVVLCP